MSDQERLRGYVEIWWQAVDDFTRQPTEVHIEGDEKMAERIIDAFAVTP